jgi:hypothetical protein
MLYPTIVYKRCDKLCNKCKQCVSFQRLIEKIDLKERSELDKQRDAERELRRER